MTCSSRKSRGNMPFALIAVTILVVASAYGLVAGQLEETEEADDNIGTEIDAVGEAEDRTRRFVERGLGEIIHTVSTDRTLGPLKERESAFRTLAAQWMDVQFPLADAGVRVDLHEYDLTLSTETLKLDGLSAGGDGFVPVYLRAAGTFTATYTSDSGRATATLEIVSDGSCALPLASVQGSLFEQALSGGGSLLGQLMTYELSSLAQYRVLNGYGALTADGNMGTSRILTAEDVERSYRSALSAVESLFFRSNADGTVFSGDTDPAKAFVTGDGWAELDLDVIYAQALMTAVDRIAAKWFDYFLGNELLRALDTVSDALASAWESLTGFLTGREPFTAASYLRDVLGDRAEITVGRDKTFTYHFDGNKLSALLRFPAAFDCTVPYPTTDYLSSDTVQNFASDYRPDTNRVRDAIYGIVHEAAVQAASSHSLGKIRFDVNASPDRFNLIIADRLSAALAGSDALFERLAGDALDRQTFPDPFAGALYTAIMQDRQALFCEGKAFYNYLADEIWEIVKAKYRETYHRDPSIKIRTSIVNDLALNYSSYGTAWSAEIDAALSQLQVLQQQESSDSDVLHRGFRAVLAGGLLAAEHGTDVRAHMEQLCREELAHLSMNPYDGFTAFPAEDSFRLTAAGGAAACESLSVEDRPLPTVRIEQPGARPELCTHQTGFRDSRGPAYCAVFTVSLQDDFPYVVKSTGGLAAVLGVTDSEMESTAAVDLRLQIPVISGWALQNVSYTPSTTFLNDLQAAALKALEPLLDPLRKALALAEVLLDKLKEAVVQAGRFAADQLGRIYAAVCEPLEALTALIQTEFTDAVGRAVLAAAEKIAVTVDATAKSQTFGFSYLGTELTLTFNAASLVKTTKQVVRAELKTEVNGVAADAWLNVKVRESDGRYAPQIVGGLSLAGDGWSVTGDLDPLLVSSEHLLTLSGEVRGTKIGLVLPDLVQYREADLCLSDLPALEAVLSNLPSPIPGTKLIVDAGLDLKYAAPFLAGVIVNEFESNPEGEDSDGEWAEILNATSKTVDLTGWTLTTSKGRVFTFGETSLAPGGRTSVDFAGVFLVNSNEYLVLRDSSSVERDRTPARSDSLNDGRTCQRGADASVEWTLTAETRDGRNHGGLVGQDGMLTTRVVSLFSAAAGRAMSETKHITSVEGLGDFFKLTVQYALDDGLEELASCLVEASVFVSADAADITGTARTGVRLALSADERMAADLLRYVVGRCEELFLHIDDPYQIDLGKAAAEDLYVGVTVYTGIAPPSFLGDIAGLPDVRLGVDVSCNLAAFSRLCGEDRGEAAISAGIRIIRCPTALIPPALDPDSTMESDLWLMRLTVIPASA